jgi:hypothetical protein
MNYLGDKSDSSNDEELKERYIMVDNIARVGLGESDEMKIKWKRG